MRFSKEVNPNYTVVTSVVEKLNVTNADDLKALFVELNNQSVHTVVLDLSQTKYCDSSGISAILSGNRMCSTSGGRFVLSGLQPKVSKVIEIAQLHKVLQIVPSVAEAESLLMD